MLNWINENKPERFLTTSNYVNISIKVLQACKAFTVFESGSRSFCPKKSASNTSRYVDDVVDHSEKIFCKVGTYLVFKRQGT